MSFKTRDRIRWALALCACIGSTLLCDNLKYTILTTHLVAAMWCPVHRPWRALWRHWAMQPERVGQLGQSTVDVAQKLAEGLGRARDAALAKPSHRP